MVCGMFCLGRVDNLLCIGDDVKRVESEQRELALARSYGACAVCHKPLIQGQVQYAHKIANKDVWRKKYGSWIIDHTLNGEMVDSLACNQTVDVGSSYGNHLEVIADILIAEFEKMWGAEGIGRLADKVLSRCKNLVNNGDVIPVEIK